MALDAIEADGAVALVGLHGVGTSATARAVARQLEGDSTFATLHLDRLPSGLPVGELLDELVIHALLEGGGATSVRRVIVLDQADAVATSELASGLARVRARMPWTRLVIASSEPMTSGTVRTVEVPPLPHRAHGAAEPSVTASLFADRLTRAGGGDIATSPSMLAHLAELSGGLPLAVDLIARATLSASLGEVVSSLAEHLAGTTPHERTAALIRWALARLGATARTTLVSLASFPGGFAPLLDAPDGNHAPESLDEAATLAGLVATGLIRVSRDDTVATYHVLPAVRRCVTPESAAHTAASPVLRWCRDLLGPDDALISGPLVHQRLHRSLTHLDNLRAALATTLSSPDPSDAASLGRCAWRVWEITGRFAEGRWWLERLLDRDDLADLDRARLCDGAALLAWRQGDEIRARQTLASAPSVQDPVLLARMANHRGLVALFADDVVGAHDEFTASLDVLESEQRWSEAALVHANLALVALQRSRVTDALGHLDRALSIEVAVDDRHGQAVSLLHRAIAWFYEGDLASSARESAQAGHLFARDLRDGRNLALATLVHAAARARQEPDIARRLHRHARDLLASLGLVVPASWAGQLAAAFEGAGLGLSPRPPGAPLSLDGLARLLEQDTPRGHAEPDVVVNVLGRLEVVVDGRPAALQPQWQLVLALLASRRRAWHVGELIDALWPEADEARGRRRLRNVLSHLHAVTGPLVVRRGDMVRLIPEAVVDVDGFHLALRRAREAAGGSLDPETALAWYHRALDRYPAPLAPTLRYVEVLDDMRDDLQAQWLAALGEAARVAETCGHLGDAEHYWRQAHRADPLNPLAATALAELLTRRGDPAGAYQALDHTASRRRQAGLDASGPTPRGAGAPSPPPIATDAPRMR